MLFPFQYEFSNNLKNTLLLDKRKLYIMDTFLIPRNQQSRVYYTNADTILMTSLITVAACYNSVSQINIYSFVHNCRGGGQIANFGEKNPQVYLIIIREWHNPPPPLPPYFKNLDNFHPSPFYLTPLQLSTKE